MSKNEAALEIVIMPDAPDGDFFEDRDYTYEKMHTYSDLDYGLLRAGIGFDYRFSERVKWTTDFSYVDLKDNAGGYVYGDETGSYFVVRAGLRYDF
jgi:predicted porin